MKQTVKCLITLIAVQSLVGCAYVKGKKAIIKNRDMAYLEGHEITSLQLPSDLQGAPLGDELIIPPAIQNWNKQPPALIPPNSLAAQIESGKLNSAPLKLSDTKFKPKPVRATVVTAQLDATELALNQDFEHSWASIPKAVADAGYKVLNENKTIKRYFIADLPGAGGKMSKETEIYQLHLNQKGKQTIVTVTDNTEKPVKGSIAARILTDLQRALQNKLDKNFWSGWF